ncbi:MAG: hypothetical protein PWQ17_502 [Anaerophaga sp.]|nr:hypothetical protein [Anaerophaga sp.]
MELACKNLYMFLLWYALSGPFYLTSYHLKSKNLLKQTLSCSFHFYLFAKIGRFNGLPVHFSGQTRRISNLFARQKQRED